MNGDRTNRTALVAGAFFVIMGVVFLLDQLEVLDVEVAYVLPVLLIVFGVAVLLGGRRPRPEMAEQPYEYGWGEPQTDRHPPESAVVPVEGDVHDTAEHPRADAHPEESIPPHPPDDDSGPAPPPAPPRPDDDQDGTDQRPPT